MNKFLLLIIFIFLMNSVYAQNFTFTPSHTSLTGTAGEEAVFEIPITNTSQQTLTLYVKRSVNNLPANWYSSMCFDQGCFPAFLDSVATTADFNSSPVAPGETRDFSIHVYCDSISTGTAYVRLTAGDTRNTADTIGIDLFVTVNPVGVDDEQAPYSFKLDQNFPNPFNPSTVISWQLAERSHVNLTIYDLLGNKTAELVNAVMEAGSHRIKYSPDKNCVSGMYIYKLTAGKYSSSKKLMLIK